MNFFKDSSRNKKMSGCFTMSNRLLQNIQEQSLDQFLFSDNKPEYDDDVIECMQFGNCSSNSKPLKEIPYYFHF